ncbi:DUF4175 family protein [Asticcacaulis sp.]|uniref:DUF4175 family protein n=1 Tax=Asticcacaulis sp. TaxID=1872648 RepID=UPI002D0277C8|nr:DUF4175 family protein [Asticcacaulis sp.]HTM80239.1 DUF4175 family protein [Asticcacaulis sp.]
MQPSNKSPLAPLNRGLFLTQATMIWERLLLPAIFPFLLLALLVAVAGQWGLFALVPKPVHIAVLAVGLVICVVAAVRLALRFRMPTFTEINTRLAVDNDLRPERLLAMRHERQQPSLKVGKAKAGIAASDPFALRYVALAAAILGFLILGPVSVDQVASGFMPLGGTMQSLAALSIK